MKVASCVNEPLKFEFCNVKDKKMNVDLKTKETRKRYKLKGKVFFSSFETEKSLYKHKKRNKKVFKTTSIVPIDEGYNVFRAQNNWDNSVLFYIRDHKIFRQITVYRKIMLKTIIDL